MSATYEVRVRGRLGGLLLTEFEELDLAALAEPADTVLYGPLVNGSLHGLLRRIEALGLELIELRRSPPTPVGVLTTRTQARRPRRAGADRMPARPDRSPGPPGRPPAVPGPGGPPPDRPQSAPSLPGRPATTAGAPDEPVTAEVPVVSLPGDEPGSPRAVPPAATTPST